MKYSPALLFLIIISFDSFSQSKEPRLPETIDGILNELLSEITIKDGEKMDTSAIRNLFHPNAQLMVLNTFDPVEIEAVSIDDFLQLLMDPYYELGYEEKEIYHIKEEYNGIAHVFQSFRGTDSSGDTARGINSYQLAFFDGRWWIMNILWTLETENVKIPNKYLGLKE